MLVYLINHNVRRLIENFDAVTVEVVKTLLGLVDGKSYVFT